MADPFLHQVFSGHRLNDDHMLEQVFNGIQSGVTLALVAAGLTLILGIMDLVFLAHEAQVMIGAYAATAIPLATNNFYLGVLLPYR